VEAWASRLKWLAALALLVLVAVPVAMLAPLFRDDAALDDIVVAVVLDWRDFGESTARQRLQFELDHQQIGRHVRDEDCQLAEEEGNVKRVSCAWHVDVALPGMAWRLPLDFSSDARVEQSGVLVH
jgi:hypothetical protein